MSRPDDGWRRVLVGAVVGLLVLSAGCSALGGSDAGGTPTPETTAATDTPTTDAPASNETNETDGHDHNHSDTTTANDGTATGQMRVVVAGDELEVDARGSQSSGFWFDDHAAYVWHLDNTTVTLAEALSVLDVNATADALTYDGTTYQESAEGVSINVRVNGEEVDPRSYELSNGDEVWVTVETPSMNVDVPGEHIDRDVLHVHGDIEFTVNGETVDFSREKYQNPSHSRHFHFEGGQADPWHAHSWSVTLGYAMDTLSGINVSENAVTYNGTTYRDSADGVSVDVTVNGEEVDPDEYLLKDGDDVRVVVENESS